jgi:hypothetical protein
MADVQPAGSTSGSLTLEAAASLFERMDSGEPEDTTAAESQETSDDVEQPEQPDDDAVVEDESESSGDDEEEAATEVTEPVTIKVGDEVLPVEEVAKGYLRQQDYTRKTQALAEAKKTHEAEFEAVRAERQQYATQLTQLAEAIKQQTPEEPDWDTVQRETPDEFPAMWAAWQRHTQQTAKLEQARKAALEAVAKDQVKHLEALLETERTKLVDAIPSWKDETVATKERDTLFQYAQETGGYTEAELDGVYDHRVMALLRKAYLYDKGLKAKPAVQAKIAAVKAATPGPASSTRKPPVSERVVAAKRLAKTGSIRDAAALFEQMDA